MHFFTLRYAAVVETYPFNAEREGAHRNSEKKKMRQSKPFSIEGASFNNRRFTKREKVHN